MVKQLIRSHHGYTSYLLQHDKLILCIIPLADLLLIPEMAHRCQSTRSNVISGGYEWGMTNLTLSCSRSR